MPLRRSGCRWEDNVKMVLRKDGGCMDWIDVVYDRAQWKALVNRVINIRVP
jgi:hypothetical protein